MDAATKALIEETAKVVAKKTVHDTLLSLGLDPDDKIETQRDMVALRKLTVIINSSDFLTNMQFLTEWRTGTLEVKKKSVIAVVGLFAAGLIALLVLGLHSFFNGPPPG